MSHSENNPFDMFLELSKELGMDTDTLYELYDTFITEMTEEIKKLKVAYQKNDFETLKSVSHNVKGVCANMRIEKMFLIAKTLNDQLKNDDFEEIYPKINDLSEAFHETKNIINDYFSQA